MQNSPSMEDGQQPVDVAGGRHRVSSDYGHLAVAIVTAGGMVLHVNAEFSGFLGVDPGVAQERKRVSEFLAPETSDANLLDSGSHKCKMHGACGRLFDVIVTVVDLPGTSHKAVVIADAATQYLGQKEAFRLIGQGIGTRKIAERLHLSVKTIESYRARLKEKLHITSAGELMVQAALWVQSEAGG